MRITRRQLRRIIREAMASGRGPATAAEMERLESDYRDEERVSPGLNIPPDWAPATEEEMERWESDYRDDAPPARAPTRKPGHRPATAAEMERWESDYRD